jgi:hypothetical protein
VPLRNLNIFGALADGVRESGEEVPSAVALDAEYWLGRAEEVRRHAGSMTDPAARRTMLLVAAGYERLAQHAEERTLRPQSSNAK